MKIHHVFSALLLAGFCAINADAQSFKPKTSQHESFKAQDYERLAVIVKPFDRTTAGSYGGAIGARGGKQTQSQLERQVEQAFLRVLLSKGYTLVSRADLDAALKEQGLDQAGLTDEKLGQEASKILHVPALMVVSVEDFKTSPVQGRGGPARAGGGLGVNNGMPTYSVTAAASARLIKIDNNQVMWTGDLSVSRDIPNQDQNAAILAAVAEAIADAFPPFSDNTQKKN